jgi:hypothetical protein
MRRSRHSADRVFWAGSLALSMTVMVPRGRTVCRMPELSRFLGIVIGMYDHDHGVPHFHAVYGAHHISVEVDSGAVHGTFPLRALRHVLEWAALHHEELLANWERARAGKPLDPIAPLE